MSANAIRNKAKGRPVNPPSVEEYLLDGEEPPNDPPDVVPYEDLGDDVDVYVYLDDLFLILGD